MPYRNYLRLTKLSFDPDMSGAPAPPVYLKMENRSRLNGDEKEAIHNGIIEARSAIDHAVEAISNNQLGYNANRVLREYLDKHPLINRDDLKRNMEDVADRLYSHRITISVAGNISAVRGMQDKYQRAKHRRLSGQVMFSKSPDTMNLRMTREAISSEDNSSRLIGTVASAVVRDRDRRQRHSPRDFVEFVKALNSAHALDETRGSKERVKFVEPRSPAATTADATKMVRKDIKDLTQAAPSNRKTDRSDDTATHSSETKESINSMINGESASFQGGASPEQIELDRWFEKKMFSANVDEIDKVDKIMEDHLLVKKQLEHLSDNRSAYQEDERKAITTALLEDLEEVQLRAIHRGLQDRERIRDSSR
jgi:hypothetical protein